MKHKKKLFSNITKTKSQLYQNANKNDNMLIVSVYQSNHQHLPTTSMRLMGANQIKASNLKLMRIELTNQTLMIQNRMAILCSYSNWTTKLDTNNQTVLIN